MSDNQYTTHADRYNYELLTVLYSKVKNSKDKELLEAIENMASQNLDSAAFSIQALGEIVANNVESGKNSINDDSIGWLIMHIGQQIQACLEIRWDAQDKLSDGGLK